MLFIENGKEILHHRGYLPPESFYELLGAFKLGKDSKAYEIAFNKSTESRYCKQYDIFKDTPDGVFIDKVSGDILFDTRDRFNSKSGWLSFYKAVDDSTIEKPDYSYGMVRTEVLAKKAAYILDMYLKDPTGKEGFVSMQMCWSLFQEIRPKKETDSFSLFYLFDFSILFFQFIINFIKSSIFHTFKNSYHNNVVFVTIPYFDICSLFISIVLPELV